MKVLKFKCPQCGKIVLEEVMVEVVQSSSISEIQDDNGVVMIDYESSSTDEGGVDRYQCLDCGFIIKDEDDNNINNEDDLALWLKEHCPQKK